MYNANQEELEILKFWEENKIFKKTLEKRSPKGNFVFFEGPPTANGKPGIHHVLARAFKDIILRFRTMQGYHIERKAGWDTHGLPVELQVEKTLGISGKSEIEKYGIKEFNQKCKESVWQYKVDWEKMTKRMGYWLDLQNPYITYDNDYIETLWWILKQVHKKKLLYKSYKVVPQCPRCGTSLSSHEVALGYKNISEISLYLKFKVKNQPNTYILSWTTTPWTLPGNIALAVGEKIDYVKVKQGSEHYYLAEVLLRQVLEGDYQIEQKLKGKDLLGMDYEPLFSGSLDPGDKKAWFVGKADFVTTEDGTGVVHTAAMYGEDDFNFGLEYNLPLVHTVDENGNFKSSVKKWAGQFVKDKKVEEEIVEDLKSRGLLLKIKLYEHDYPFCWRCDSPLLYYAKDSWFIKMSALKEQLIKNNEKINWVPEHIKEGRFGEWLDGIKDWAISRQRYWGTPLPIWECGKCKEIEVIGSYEELAKKTGKMPKNKNDELDVHRPYVDELYYVCQCGGKMKRLEDVFDCWYDSGAMPFAQYHYPFENKNLIDNGGQYPAEYISEAIDQTRGWFYTLLAISTLLDKGNPYKNCICLGHIRDKEGKKMSKSKGNIVDPWVIAEKYGMDALRLHLYSLNQPGEPKNFDEKDTQEVLRKVIMLLTNVVEFYEMYAGESYKVHKVIKSIKSENILDKWILAKLNLLIKEVTNDLENYHVYEAARRLIGFINELSTWYVRRSRDRFKNESKDKEMAVVTLREVIDKLIRVSAPFTPFIAENVYRITDFRLQTTDKKESVHLEDWPEINDKMIDEKVLGDMVVVRKVVEIGLALRAENGIRVRQPLAKLQISDYKLQKDLLQIIADELNVKNVEVGDKEIGDNLKIKENENLKVGLDITITPELKKEGLVREIVHTINQMRKEQKMTIKDKVVVGYSTDDDLLKSVFEKYSKEIKKSVLASEIKTSGIGEEVEINGVKLKLSVKKV